MIADYLYKKGDGHRPIIGRNLTHIREKVKNMKAITYTDAQKNLKALIQTVCKNSEPAVIVSSRSKDQAVLISFEDYQAMEETAYLLNSPANRAHLERSLKEVQSGTLVAFPAEGL